MFYNSSEKAGKMACFLDERSKGPAGWNVGGGIFHSVPMKQAL